MITQKIKVVSLFIVFILGFAFQGGACNNSESTLLSVTDNGDGTYDMTFEVCFAGDQSSNGPSYGFYIDITGVSVTSTPTSSVTSNNGTTINSNIGQGGYDVEYGDWNDDTQPEFVGTSDPQECFNVTVTVDGNPDGEDWEVGGQEYYESGCPGGGACSCSYTGTVSLPIELKAYNAEYNKGTVALSWTTLTETNNDYFTVERSMNGHQFDKIAQIDGAGNTYQTQRYNFEDASLPDSQEVIYYRLKQTDFNGNHEYHGVLSVPLEYTSAALKIGEVASSPKNLKVSVTSPRSSQNTLFILSTVSGKIRLSKSYPLQEGPNILSLPLSNISNGIFILSVLDKVNNQKISRKVIIAN